MGIDTAGAQFLFAARALGVDFSETATLGRQSFDASESALRPIAKALEIPGGATGLIEDCNTSGDRFIEKLGAKTVTSFDASEYEGASVVHDMNRPLPGEHLGKFSAVIDGGTIEHVFEITQALRNCLQLVKPGGHFLSIQAANNFLGHGFYQLSPEFYFRTLTEENGYRLRSVMLCRLDRMAFYGMRDPQSMNCRFEMINRCPTYILAIGQRIDDRPLFDRSPQQSDYASIWKSDDARSGPPSASRQSSPLKNGLKAMIPRGISGVAKSLLIYPRRGFNQDCFYRLTAEDLLRGRLQDPSRNDG